MLNLTVFFLKTALREKDKVIDEIDRSWFLKYFLGALGNLQTLKVDENHLGELPVSIGR